MCESDDGIERWSSVKSVQETFENVPEDIKFKIMLRSVGDIVDRFKYTLKKGRDLPATVNLMNASNYSYTVQFSNNLQPSIRGWSAGTENAGSWCFDEIVEKLDLSAELFTPNATSSPSLPKQLRKLPADSSRLAAHSSRLADSFSMDTEYLQDEGQTDYSPQTQADKSSNMSLASNSSQVAQPSNSSMQSQPSNSSMQSQPSNSSMQSQSSISSMQSQSSKSSKQTQSSKSSKQTQQNKPSKKTQHTDPWLEILTSQFMEIIVGECSSMTKEAVAKNEVLNKCDHRTVKEEILNALVKYLKTTFDIQNLPGIKDMREIAFELTHVYPTMFCHKEDALPGEEKGEKVDDIAVKLRERLRGQLRRDAPKSEENEGREKRKGKLHTSYGMDSSKWNKKVKVSQDAITALAALAGEKNFEKREEIFEEHREVLTDNFKKSKRSIPTVHKPFFKDHRHLGWQWKYLSSADPLYGKFEENYITQFGNIEKFLRDQDKSVEFQEKMATIEETCQVEHNGSTTWKEINLLRFFAEHFDGSLSELVRLEADGEPDGSGSPHMFVIESAKGLFIFEVWVDGQKLLGNLNFVTAISSFLHLAFCFDLKFPRGGETAADLLQRGFARYGDNSGTRTTKKMSSAAKKLDKFHLVLGRLQ